MDQDILQMLPEPLLAWYRGNARNLPWRHTDDPYKIWVSEIMLQQTRVGAVLGYYDRFLRAFPTVYELAAASEEQLLKLWEGLGYYSRARNLQKAAIQIVAEYDGSLPQSYDALLKLPGIGEYTAGAIASAAYGASVPAVDGNVLRVMSRITECYDDIADARVKKEYRAALEQVLPQNAEDMRIFNQAMMELGATVCVPNGQPKCECCPAGAFCRARENGTAALLPVKSAKKPRRIEEKTVFLLVREDELALRKRPPEGLLAGLWEFPNAEGHMDESVAFAAIAALGLTVTDWKKQLHAKHIFTHVEWHMTCYVVQVGGEGDESFTWVDAACFDEYAIPSAFARFTAEAKKILSITENA